jgi:hypothetical protein
MAESQYSSDSASYNETLQTPTAIKICKANGTEFSATCGVSVFGQAVSEAKADAEASYTQPGFFRNPTLCNP